jgi:hypothetical protein
LEKSTVLDLFLHKSTVLLIIINSSKKALKIKQIINKLLNHLAETTSTKAENVSFGRAGWVCLVLFSLASCLPPARGILPWQATTEGKWGMIDVLSC